MTSALLNCKSFVPPLLEKQISPPYRIVARYLDYLQKWREYLLWMWIKDLGGDADKVCVQHSIDEFISTILLLDFIRQLHPTTVPTLEEILKTVHSTKDVNPYFLLAVLNSKIFRKWAQHRMPTLGLGWHSYRVNILRNFFIPTLPRGQDNGLFEKLANLAAMLLNEKFTQTDCANILSSIDEIICKFYGISQSELSQ